MKEKNWLDVTAPGNKIEIGSLHPITQLTKEIVEIFNSMGFSVIDGPEIEDEWHHFDALNIPKEHPARDAWDTFWLRQNEIKNQKSKIKIINQNSKLLLRAQTSGIQIRYMEKNNPPLRIIAPGRVFRYEASDVAHDIQFYQVEGLMVGREISIVNFKAIIEEFFRHLFQKQIKIRLRPCYFPFVEPGFEIDISCINCCGKGCSCCKQTGWLEIMGAGMVHPNVLNAVGIDSRKWQGFAFGMGLDRLTMMKYKINDIRLFYSGDLRFIKQF